MPEIDVKHERWKCIACGACAAVAPKFWVLDDNDFKADLIGSDHEEVPEGKLEKLKVTDMTAERELKDSQESCPVSCIHVEVKP